MKKKTWVILIIIIAVIIFFYVRSGNSQPGQYDEFAQCLTENGAKMFGAYWCPHCKDQKSAFGDSWDHVNYIECSLPGGNGQTAECSQQGITGYPTWEFSNGERLSGFIPLQNLADKTGCSLLPTNSTS